MKNYQTLPAALTDLNKKGYQDELPDESFCLYCNNLELRINPDLRVDESVHVGDPSHPGEGETIYAVSMPGGKKAIEVEKDQ